MGKWIKPPIEIPSIPTFPRPPQAGTEDRPNPPAPPAAVTPITTLPAGPTVVTPATPEPPVPLPDFPPIPPTPEPTCTHTIPTYMYVVTSDGVLHVFDPATGALVTTMPVNADAEAASSSANFLSVDPYTGKLYVSNTWNGSSWSDQVNVFDGTEPDGVFNIPRPGNGAVDNERGLMYVTTTNGAMGVIDINTGQVVETFALPGGSAGFPFVDPATGKVYVVGYLPDSTTRTGIGVWVIDPDAHTVQLVNEDYDAGTPAGLENATFGDGKVTYIREDDYLDDGFVTYDPATDSVTVYTVPFDIDMRGMVFANDQNVIYVGGYNEDDDPALFMYDPNNTANPLTEVPANLDEYISDFDYDANNHILYGVDVNNNLVAYNTDTWGDPIFTDNLGSIPYDLKIGSKCVYE